MDNPFKSIFDRVFGKQYDKSGNKIEVSDTISNTGKQAFYFKAVAFAIAVSYVSNIVSKCEIKHFEYDENNDKVIEKKDMLYYYLNVAPNRNQTAFESKSEYIFNLFYENEALLFLKGNELFVADSYIRTKNPFSEDTFENITRNNSDMTFCRKATDVCYCSLDDKKINALVRTMLNEYEELFVYAKESCADANADKWTFNAGHIDTGNAAEKEQRNERTRKALKKFISEPKALLPIYNGQGINHIYKGDGKVDVTPIQNIRKEMFELVAEAFKMPVSILYGNMTNTKDIFNAWASVAIDPLCKMLSEALSKSFLSMDDYIKGSRIQIDTTALFHMDWFDMCEKGDKAICSGVFNIDEIRGKIGEEPLDTDFSRQHWMTKNYDRIENVMTGSAGS